MKVERRRSAAREWPVLLATPRSTVVQAALVVARAVAPAHDEDAHRRLSLDTGWFVLQPAVEPAQAQLIEGRPSAAVEGRARTEVHVAGVGAVTAVVDPRTKDQPQGRLAAVDQARVDLAGARAKGSYPPQGGDSRT